MVAWEITRSCNLSCVHCRAAACRGPYPDELDTDRCLGLLDEIAGFAQPVVILTGGEPLLRPDVYQIAAYGTALGLRMVLATNGTRVDDAVARRLIGAGIRRVSVSLDGLDAASHDAFRQVPGAFDGALAGIAALRAAGLEFQVNTTVTRENLSQLPGILALAERLGAAAHHIFLLVPTGRGRDLAGQEIDAAAYERTLEWFHDRSGACALQLKATCAPHYFRILRQQRGQARTAVAADGNRPGPGPDGGAGKDAHPLHAATRGCLGGSSFCFISHTGQVQPCGYLELDCGQVRERGFREIWETSRIFADLRDLNRYGGKCGRCEFIRVCGGCRARAYEATGDYLAEEPLCAYEPKGAKRPDGRKEDA
jgi:heme b synthase